MNRMAALLVGAASLSCVTAPAAASTKFHNSTGNTIWAAHAFDSVSGLGCGYSDGCPSSSRVKGWFPIAPGGTATVDSRGWGNARHEIYAEDGLGHFWEGDSAYVVPNDAFDRCQYDDWLYAQPTSNYYYFRLVRNTTCCGIGCPGDKTYNFTL